MSSEYPLNWVTALSMQICHVLYDNRTILTWSNESVHKFFGFWRPSVRMAFHVSEYIIHETLPLLAVNYVTNIILIV